MSLEISARASSHVGSTKPLSQARTAAPLPPCGSWRWHNSAPATAAARSTLASAVAAADWRLAEADSRDIWMYHVLRREAEATILPNALASHPASQPAPIPAAGH